MNFKDGENYCFRRHLHPSVYKKIAKTENLIEKGVDPVDFSDRGGLDIKTYQALKQRRMDQDQKTVDKKQKLIDQYGSIKAAPLRVGPCKKMNPSIGSRNAVVLFSEFKDIKHSYEPADFEELLFSKGSGKSMRDYYLEASWNQLDITGKVNHQWYSAAGNMADYIDKAPIKGHYPLAQKLVKETLQQAKDDDKIDFKPFAKNGEIDILIIVYAGEGMDTTLKMVNIRPHQDKLNEPLEVQKGIWANKYCLIPELPMDDLGCFCHEVGHLLGLPDLYKDGYSPVVGSWCLMGVGDHIDNGKTPSHPSAWCKIHLGWKEPIIVDKPPEIQEIPAILDPDGTIYKIEVHGSNGGEYFLLENRQQKGFDKYLPGSGLLIWHVNENTCVHQAPNSDPEHFFLTLIQSDGKKELESDMNELIKKEGEATAIKNLIGDDSDAYPGITVNRNFDDKSNPNSNSYKGLKSRVSVTSISDSADIMKAQMGVQNQFNNLDDESTQTSPDELKTYKQILENFIRMMTAKSSDPYEEGYEAGKQDIFETFKEKEGLNSFGKGYRKGYLHGYKNARKNKDNE